MAKKPSTGNSWKVSYYRAYGDVQEFYSNTSKSIKTFICSLLIEYFKGQRALTILMIKYKINRRLSLL